MNKLRDILTDNADLLWIAVITALSGVFLFAALVGGHAK